MGISISLSHSRGLDQLRFLFRCYPLTLQLATVIVIADEFPIHHRCYQGRLGTPAVEDQRQFSVFPTPLRNRRVTQLRTAAACYLFALHFQNEGKRKSLALRICRRVPLTG